MQSPNTNASFLKTRRKQLDHSWSAEVIYDSGPTSALPHHLSSIFAPSPKTFRHQATFWLILEHRDVDVCLKDPGFEIDLVVDADLVALTKAWMGDVRLADAMRSGLVRVEGPTALVRAFPGWLALSGFADVERPRAGAARQARSVLVLRSGSRLGRPPRRHRTEPT